MSQHVQHVPARTLIMSQHVPTRASAYPDHVLCVLVRVNARGAVVLCLRNVKPVHLSLERAALVIQLTHLSLELQYQTQVVAAHAATSGAAADRVISLDTTARNTRGYRHER